MYLPSFSLQGRTAIITGAGRGIGRAIAVGLAEAGANVALVPRTKSALEETASIIRDYTKAEAYILPADITDRQEVERAIEELVSRVERLDILVNNAGMNIRTPALGVTDSQWDTIVQTNLKWVLGIANRGQIYKRPWGWTNL